MRTQLLAPIAAGSPAGLLLGGATLVVLAAAVVGYGVQSRRRRQADRPEAPPAQPPRDPPPPSDFWLPGTADAPAPPRPAWSGGKGEPATGRSPDSTHSGRERALGYTTFPDRRRAVSPESRYQARRISAACEARGMVLHKLVGDVHSYSGPDLDRPGLNHALELLGSGEASCLVVAGLDRLSRSAANLGTVIEWLENLGARLIVIDIGLDSHTDEGRLAARALARVAALERASGRGVLPERPRVLEPGPGRPAVSDLPLLQRRIATMRAGGMTLQAIADMLNGEGVPTIRGGAEWRPSSVQAATGYRRPSRQASESADDG